MSDRSEVRVVKEPVHGKRFDLPGEERKSDLSKPAGANKRA
jgi:hypothetical protein